MVLEKAAIPEIWNRQGHVWNWNMFGLQKIIQLNEVIS